MDPPHKCALDGRNVVIVGRHKYHSSACQKEAAKLRRRQRGPPPSRPHDADRHHNPGRGEVPRSPTTPACCQCSPRLLPVAGLDQARILDPFAGTGRVFYLLDELPGLHIAAIELEEWPDMHPAVQLGNALHLPFPAGSFDAVATSPTYGNRMADHHNACYKQPRWHTYSAHARPRTFTPNNSGANAMGRAITAIFHIHRPGRKPAASSGPPAAC